MEYKYRSRILFYTLVFFSFSSRTLALDLQDWNLATSSERTKMIFGGELEENYKLIKEIKISSLQQQLPAMNDLSLSNIPREEIESDIAVMSGVVSIGKPKRSEELTYYSIEGEVVAVQLGYYQGGGEKPQHVEESHFDTSEQAKAAGVDIEADVCWSANSYFYLEDQQWLPLSFTDWEGRGFAWCGW